MRLINDTKLDFSDVLIVPKRSTLASRKDVSLIRPYVFKHAQIKYAGIPIMASNMDGVGTIEVAEVLSKHSMFTVLHKHNQLLWLNEFVKKLAAKEKEDFFANVAVSTGTSNYDYTKLKELLSEIKEFKYICVDVANGYSEPFIEFCKYVRKDFPEKVLIAGNVVTPEITEELILNGVDIVKIGIGPGSVCTTRKQTGVGYPQLSAIIECADAAHGLGGHIIADGGCTCPGDVAKGFGAGADFVMLGGMLAGHAEGGGTINPETMTIQFYGMSSDVAMDKHSGGMAEYRSSEGKVVSIPYRGKIKDTVQDILGGLRSSCTYVGAKSLKEMSKRTTFIKVNKQLNEIYGPSK